MKNILSSYLKGLNDENIKYISNTIMSNFILYKQKMITKKINNIFIIYAKQELLLMKEKLLKWEQRTLYNNITNNNSKIEYNNLRDNYFHLNLNVGPIMSNSPGVPIIINNNNNSNSNSNINNSNLNIENEYKIKNNNNKRNNKISDFYSTINNSSSNFSTIQVKKSKKQRPYSSEALERNKNYIPNGLKSNKNFKKIKKNNNGSEKILNKFIQRQEKYIKSNSQKKQKIIKDSEEEYKLIYTFEPKVNESLRKLYKKDKISASNRLYNDSIERQNKILEQQINIDNNCKIIYDKNFNQNKCIELYEDSKTRKEKKEELIRKIEKECGYTYAPKVMHKKMDFKNKSNNSIVEEKSKKKIIGKNKSFSNIKSNNESKIENIKKFDKKNTSNKLSTLKKEDIRKK